MAIFTWKTKIPKTTLFKPGGPQISFTKSMGDFFEDMETITVNVAQQETPIGATGELADSVQFFKESILRATLTWVAKHARPVAEGSAPHWPPLQRIAEWAAVVLGDITAARRVQHGISKRGTPPNDYPGRTKRRVEAESRVSFPDAIAGWVRRLKR